MDVFSNLILTHGRIGTLSCATIRFFLDFQIKSYIMRKLRSIVSDCQSGRKLSEMPLLPTFHNNFERIVFLGTVLLILLCISLHSTAQDETSTNPPPVLTAAKLTDTPPRIDGNLDEDIWEHAPVATGFVQLVPDEGAPASERTEVRVLYGNDALYVAFRAFDTDPSAIEGQLTRRDQQSFSEWVHVAIDSYNDKRTAFQFGVNPKGVKQDIYRFDDTKQDPDWDAVWDVGTSTDDHGWTAEFRIPYTQLRFAHAGKMTWGIQFTRSIARKQERVYWAPLSSQESGTVSKYGTLQGLKGIKSRWRFEVAPYSLGRLQRATGDPDDPFFKENDPFATLGMDLKYGLTGNFTLDVTMNPDFGQVEADPARVNLTEFETFFPERRPFFVEGANIFRFNIGDRDELFHSRRIGRAPRRRLDPRSDYFDAPDITTIQIAEKLSGKTASGWTVGLLHASTARETADIITGKGDALDEIVEPATQYSLARLQKDFRDGNSAIGAIATGVFRPNDQAEALNTHTNAITGGFDFRHRFWNDNFRFSGYALASHVAGSENAISQTQRAPGRYMHRPDADHLTFDPTRTSLSGLSASANFSRIGGSFWRYYAGFRTRTPGFETNDIGFMSRADFLVSWAGIGYDHSLPTQYLRQWEMRWHNWRWQTYGGESNSFGSRLSVNIEFLNYWLVSASTSYILGSLSTSMLRGGPAFRTEDSINGMLDVTSDSRKKVLLELKSGIRFQPESNSWSFNVLPTLRWRPASRVQASIGTSYSSSENDRQWVTRIHKNINHYVFSRIARQTVGLIGRFDFAFTPNLSLQFYAQPFVSSGHYSGFKQVADPKGARYADRFTPLKTKSVNFGYEVDVDADETPELIHNPDFNFKQFRSNVVLRWEYRLGSTLFVVWSQGRQHIDPMGEFNLGSDIGTLFDTPAENVFMIKLNYWLNPHEVLQK